MGHYYADMMCNECGKVRCTCSPKPDPSDFKWCLTDDLDVVTAIDFQRLREKAGSRMAFFERMSRIKYDTKEEAEEAAHILRLKKELPTLEEKVDMYERVFHQIQLAAEVSMNEDRVRELIRNICRWSYAHRAGNGELSEIEQELQIAAAFSRLLER